MIGEKTRTNDTFLNRTTNATNMIISKARVFINNRQYPFANYLSQMPLALLFSNLRNWTFPKTV